MLNITEYSIKAKINAPVTFAFVSDLHHVENAPVLQAIDKISPHAVLVGGDFIHNNTYHTRGLEFLSLASKKYPVFCSLGNHEFRFSGDIKAAVKSTGACLLNNSYTDFCGIKIGGFTSAIYSNCVPNLDWLNTFSSVEGYKLLLCHHPEYYKKYIKTTAVDLTLSGHAHGGQWRFFGRGVFSPGQGIFPKYTCGVYENRLIVSKGIGNPRAIPRIFNTPEVLKINLLPEQK